MPVHVTPRSVGRLAKAPQVVHKHLGVSSSKTLIAVWFAVRSPLLTFLAARWSHFLRWKLDFQFSRSLFSLALHGVLTNLFQPRYVVENLLHVLHCHPPPSSSMTLCSP